VGRPPCCRWVLSSPAVARLAPASAAGQPAGEVVISLDELEAIRLADLDGHHQELVAPTAKRGGGASGVRLRRVAHIPGNRGTCRRLVAM
jgi:hypothetical protein